MYTYACVCIHIYIHIYRVIFMHTYVHICVYIYMYIYVFGQFMGLKFENTVLKLGAFRLDGVRVLFEVQCLFGSFACFACG